MRHVILTGSIGVGKSTVLSKTLQLLDARAEGIQTCADAPREAREKTLYMRAYGDEAEGCPFAKLPGGDRAHAAHCFDAVGVGLLRRARRQGELIVIDELGWLECDAAAYQRELQAALDGSIPVLAVLRQSKTDWADWIRKCPDIKLLTVTLQNREQLPKQAADVLRPRIKRIDRSDVLIDEPICYELHTQKSE